MLECEDDSNNVIVRTMISGPPPSQTSLRSRTSRSSARSPASGSTSSSTVLSTGWSSAKDTTATPTVSTWQPAPAVLRPASRFSSTAAVWAAAAIPRHTVSLTQPVASWRTRSSCSTTPWCRRCGTRPGNWGAPGTITMRSLSHSDHSRWEHYYSWEGEIYKTNLVAATPPPCYKMLIVMLRSQPAFISHNVGIQRVPCIHLF